MNSTSKRFLWLSAYAMAMAFLEAVVVVYLRELHPIPSPGVALGSHLSIEAWREAATLVMLAAVGWLAGRQPSDRLAYGLYAFGLWDIGYYIWLRVLTGWPRTPLDKDVLFLIPLPWWGPVLAPVLIAALICSVAVLAVRKIERGQRLSLTPQLRSVAALGGLLALYVFMSDAIRELLRGRVDWNALTPAPFKWPLFLVALALMAGPALLAVWPRSDRARVSSDGV
jgi:hypothetical protein